MTYRNEARMAETGEQKTRESAKEATEDNKNDRRVLKSRLLADTVPVKSLLASFLMKLF